MTTIEERLVTWQQELLDLTNRNRLLNFRPSTSRPSSINLIAPGAVQIYQTLLAGKSLLIEGTELSEEPYEDPDSEPSSESRSIGLDALQVAAPQELQRLESRPDHSKHAPDPFLARPGTARSNLTPERTNKIALRLRTQARASEQEQGINILFTAFGLLKWSERTGDENWRYAPIVLLPLAIDENAREGAYRIRASGDDPEINQTLLERLKRDFGLSLTFDLDEETDIASVFSQLRAHVAKQPGWEVLEQVHVGLFQFHKLRMFTDLQEHADVAAQHEVVQALASEGATLAYESNDLEFEEDLDRAVLPQESYTPLDADASQLRAIRAALGGKHLIIQGPPGTGKSQTIANIIAEAIAAGKTVLFVSEKAAAIEVVHRRLVDRKLGDFCLMLHSHKATKRDIIYDLGSRLAPPAAVRQAPEEDLKLRRLAETRAELNAYAESLHRIRAPLDQSAFWAHGQLAQLHDVPLLELNELPVSELTLETLETWHRLLDRVKRHEQTLKEGPRHPWAGVQIQDLSLADQQSLRQALMLMQAAVGEVISASALISNHLGLSCPTRFSEAKALFEIASAIPHEGGIKASWLERSRIAERQESAAKALHQANELHTLTTSLLADYTEAILEVPHEVAVSAFRKGALARVFSSTFKNYRAQVRAASRNGQQRPISEEISTLQVAGRVARERRWFEEQASNLYELLTNPSSVNLLSPSEWERSTAGIAAAAKILQNLPGDPPAEFVEAVARSGAGLSIAGLRQRLEKALGDVEAGTRKLGSIFESGTLTINAQPFESADLSVTHAWLASRLSRFDDLDLWLRARSALEGAKQAGLGGVVNELIDRGIPTERWNDALRRLALTHWLDRIYRADENLRGFRGDEHDARVARFKELDHASIDSSSGRIRRLLAERQRKVSAQNGGEPAILSFEFNKRRRHMPLRRLFEKIPNLLPTLKPCLMMSPLSVAQYLPADRYHFDLVLFDEASQVRPHDAIGAIMRGKQLVVAGDSRQLPPTTFFDRTSEGETEDDAQDITALESILDGLNSRQMPSTSLLWHYRSRHEDLIAFSNHHIYGRNLITFPSAAADRSPIRGVSLEYVSNGMYRSERDTVLKTPSTRVNRIEAKRVAQLVIQHARTRPDETLGVVALGIHQRDVIEEEIKNARLLDQSLDEFFREDKPESFFVKALEQVQGDERDVIMISIGFGKNEDGVLSHNFGPLNRDGGERRLNVLVTRAKHQVIVVSSIRAGDIDLTKTDKLGPRLLKNYLEFAERGPIALQAETFVGDGEYESPFEEEVGRALEQAGYIVRRQVGTSQFRIDLAVVDPEQPGRYLLGIECDGATYHSSKTARDRDRLRQEILEGLGWRIHRIWSTDWIRQRDVELNRVIEQVELARAAAAQSVADSEPDLVAPESETEVVTLPTPAPQVDTDLYDQPSALAIPYSVASISHLAYGDIQEIGLIYVARAVVACVEGESPIHRELLARRIATAWGQNRIGSRIASQIDRAIRHAVSRGQVEERGQFLWRPGQVEVPVRATLPDGTVRRIEHVAAEEVMSAMRGILESAYSLTEEELTITTARIFGFNRTGSEIRSRLAEVILSGLENGYLSARNGRIERAGEASATTP